MSVNCPGCRQPLVEAEERGAAISRCKKCNKVWFGAGQLEHRLAAVKPSARAEDVEALRKECELRRQAILNQSVVMYLHCPACNHRMLRRAFGGASGIITQVCAGHGVLMSGADLQAIEDFVRRGGETLAREHAAAQGAPQADGVPVDWYPEG